LIRAGGKGLEEGGNNEFPYGKRYSNGPQKKKKTKEEEGKREGSFLIRMDTRLDCQPALPNCEKTEDGVGDVAVTFWRVEEEARKSGRAWGARRNQRGRFRWRISWPRSRGKTKQKRVGGPKETGSRNAGHWGSRRGGARKQSFQRRGRQITGLEFLIVTERGKRLRFTP